MKLENIKLKTPIYLDIETTGLSSFYNRITSYSIRIEDQSIKHKYELFGKAHNNEFLILNDFNKCISKYNTDNYYFVTKNGKNFDIPFLVLRGFVNCFDFRFLIKYDHFDLQEITSGWVTLNDLSRLYGVENKSDKSINAINMFNEGRLEELLKYNHQDTLVTKQVFEKWKELNFDNNILI